MSMAPIVASRGAKSGYASPSGGDNNNDLIGIILLLVLFMAIAMGFLIFN